MLSGGANAACEHQIELLRFRNFVSAIGIGYVVLAAQFSKLWTRIVVQLKTGLSFSCLETAPRVLT